MTINPIALRKAKMYAILAFLGAIGLKVLIIIPIFTYIYIKKKKNMLKLHFGLFPAQNCATCSSFVSTMDKDTCTVHTICQELQTSH